MLFDIYEPGQTPDIHSELAYAIGIDLGTTNSVAAIYKNGEITTIPAEDGALILPSVVRYLSNSIEVGSVTVGQKIANAVEVSSVKRLMGRAHSEFANDKTLAFNITPSEEGLPLITTPSGNVSPIQVSAEILKALRLRAEKFLGHPVTKAVITVPAYFDDAARSATRNAAILAGLEPIRLLAEPTSAAVAYGLDNAAEGIYAVYDLGGGTFDFSLLKMQMGVFQVLATGGDTKLGGDDFDTVLAEYLVGSDMLDEPLAVAKITARRIKEQLCGADAQITQEITPKITKAKFNELISPLMERTIKIISRVMRDAKVEVSEVKGIALVGGSTRVPLVRDMVQEFFRIMPLSGVDPDLIVAHGAAIQAAQLAGHSASNNLLLDVVPLSLGIETMGGIVEKIIWRNTPLPVAMAQEFTTYKDGQGGMIIHVVQGERELVKDCRSLARFQINGLPNLPAGAPKIRITFNVDADGILTVSALEQTSGLEQSVEVKPSYGLTPEKMVEMIRQSMENANLDMENRLLMEVATESSQLLEQTKNALAKDAEILNESSRIQIEDSMEKLQKILSEVQGDDDGGAGGQGGGNNFIIAYDEFRARQIRANISAAKSALEKATAEFASSRVNLALSKIIAGQDLSDVEEKMNPS
jgi:molecular chaperone HscA